MRRRFGAHFSTAGGLLYSCISARALDAEVMQIMVCDNRTWAPNRYTDDVINKFRKFTYGMGVYIHLPYTMNPCTPKGDPKYNPLRAAMRKFLECADVLGATAVVIHPGYKKELTDLAARTNFVEFMLPFGDEDFDTRILFETDSGSKNGSKIGSPEFIEQTLGRLGKHRFGMCIDTEHLWARGVNLWDAGERTRFLARYGELIELVHLNAPDPGVALGSFLDRHSTPFAQFELSSDEMVKVLVGRYSSVLERSSLSVVEQDFQYVNALVPTSPSCIREDISAEEPPNEPESGVDS